MDLSLMQSTQIWYLFYDYNVITSKYLNSRSTVNLTDEQALSEFSDCFGDIGTLNPIHHIEIKVGLSPSKKNIFLFASMIALQK